MWNGQHNRKTVWLNSCIYCSYNEKDGCCLTFLQKKHEKKTQQLKNLHVKNIQVKEAKENKNVSGNSTGFEKK